MFKNCYIGKNDINNKEIHEGNKVKFKSVTYNNREFIGVVRYNKLSCKFQIIRDNDEGEFGFLSDIYDLEVI